MVTELRRRLGATEGSVAFGESIRGWLGITLTTENFGVGLSDAFEQGIKGA